MLCQKAIQAALPLVAITRTKIVRSSSLPMLCRQCLFRRWNIERRNVLGHISRLGIIVGRQSISPCHKRAQVEQISQHGQSIPCERFMFITQTSRGTFYIALCRDTPHSIRTKCTSFTENCTSVTRLLCTARFTGKIQRTVRTHLKRI